MNEKGDEWQEGIVNVRKGRGDEGKEDKRQERRKEARKGQRMLGREER